jgi:hypothetical protein
MHVLYDDIVEDWEKTFSHVCYHSKKLSIIAIWASSSTITSPATLHFSRISWVCAVVTSHTSHQNSFAKDCSKSNKLQELNSLQRILMFVYSHSKKLCHHTIGVINNNLNFIKFRFYNWLTRCLMFVCLHFGQSFFHNSKFSLWWSYENLVVKET